METQIKQLTPMAFVSDIARSIAFYEHLGFAVGDTFMPSNADTPSWAWLSSGNAELMIAKASERRKLQKHARHLSSIAD